MAAPPQLNRANQTVGEGVNALPQAIGEQLEAAVNEVEEIVQGVLDFEGIGHWTGYFLRKYNFTVGVGLLAYVIGQLAIQHCAWPIEIYGKIFGSLAMPIFVCAAMMILVYITVDFLKDPDLDLIVVAFGAAQGLLLGLLTTKRRVSFFRPPTFMTHLVVSFTSEAVMLYTENQYKAMCLMLLPTAYQYLLMACNGAGGAVYIYGMLLVGSASVDIQLQIKYRQHKHEIRISQCMTVLLMGVTDAFAFWIFSRTVQ